MQLVTFERLDKESSISVSELRARLGEASVGFETLDFNRHGGQRLGALIPPGPRVGDVVDLNQTLALKLAFEDVGAPEAEADSLLPGDMLSFLRRGEDALEQARRCLAWAIGALERYDVPDLIRAGVALPRRSVTLCAPVPRPGKVISIARNYDDPMRDTSQTARPQQPELFLEAPTSVIGPGDDIVVPSPSARVDYAGGLGVVIGRRARNLTVEQGLSVVAGYTAVNDVVLFESGRTEDPRSLEHSFDSFSPQGPTLLTAEEVSDPQDLSIRTVVSGVLVQDARSKEMIFRVAEIIAFASQRMTLEAGDLILTGTPAGRGADLQPARWLSDGDVVDVEVEQVGRLRNYVRTETGPTT